MSPAWMRVTARRRIFAASTLIALLAIAACSRSNEPSPPPGPAPAPEPRPMAPVPAAEAPPAAPAATPPSAPAQAPAAAPARPVYTVRGEVVSLPGIESDVLRLHHERIPTFARQDGTIGTDSKGRPGMRPMTMPFGRVEGVSYEGLKIGDKVEVTFEVDWSGTRPEQRILITSWKSLPPDTTLAFEEFVSPLAPKVEPAPQPK